MTAADARHWRRETDSSGVCRLILDRAGASANTLSRDVLEQLDEELTALAEASGLRGLVIKSGKRTGFILGANVREFAAVDDPGEAAGLAARGQVVLARIPALDCPSVALIDGFALGGGLELALACDYRVAAESYERTIGLPEVQLGIHPGFGGTVRAVNLVGAPRGLDLMLTGRSISPKEAVSMGLIDRVVPAADLDAAAVNLIERKPPRRRAAWYLRLLGLPFVRLLLARSLRARVARRARQSHYPAPYAIIALWLRHGARGRAAYEAEAESIGSLLVGTTSKNLVRMFLLRERLRNLAPKTSGITNVHVVGAGVMGGDIAAWCALKGLGVSVQDRAEQYVKPALERAGKLFERRLRAPGAAAEARTRLTVDLEGAALGSADLVIEAIVERLDAKQALLKVVEPALGTGTLIATNTSSICLEDMAHALQRPGHFVGLHFFNPVARLPLVEVIEGEDTDAETLERITSFVIQIGKLPLPCRSAPGFVVNRILTPYMLEALKAHEDGHMLETIDEAARAFGMPMGPVELADHVGLDVAHHVARILSDVLGHEPTALLERKVEAGHLGTKTNRGFYEYDNDGRPRRQSSYPAPDADLTDRLMLPLVNEAVACFADGVVDDPDLVDAGVVFGTGFAPFTGGPINYARERGVEEVVERLQMLAARFGPRFIPHAGWRKFATKS